MKKMILVLVTVILIPFCYLLSCGGDSSSDDPADPTATPTMVPTNTPTPEPTATPTATIPPTKWNRTYGGNEDEWGRQVIQTADGGYAITGYTSSYGNGEDDVWVLKMDKDGNVLNSQTYGFGWNDWGNGIAETTDGGFGIACYTTPSGGAPWNGWVFKVDSSLNMVWELFFGEQDLEDGPNNMYPTSDGGFIMSGVIDKTVYDTHDVLLMKVSGDGNLSWYKQFGDDGQDKSNSMNVCSDGGFIIGAESYSHSNGLNDAWVIRTDSNGEIIWEKNFGGGGFEEAVHVEQTSDSGYIVAAYTKPDANSFSDGIIHKLDQDGNLVWSTTLGSAREDYIWSVTEATDGGYVFCGVINAYNWERDGDGWMGKVDQNGDVVWERTFPGAGHDEFFYMIRTTDGGFLALGETSSTAGGDLDLWAVKIDANGNDS